MTMIALTTVLNTTMAEMDTYHHQKGEDFDRIAIEHLDGEIAFHEQALARLRAARAAFSTDPPVDARSNASSPTSFTKGKSRSPLTPGSSSSSRFTVQRSNSLFQPLPSGPRQPSIYERDLTGSVNKVIPPLPQPTAHILDGATPIRPVTEAVRDGMSTLLGGVGLKPSPLAFGGSGSDHHHHKNSTGSTSSMTGSMMGLPGVNLSGVSLPGLESLRGSVLDFGRGRLWSTGG